MDEVTQDNDNRINAKALSMALVRREGACTDEVISTAIKFRHFIMTGKVLIPPQPEQPA